jgi:hypothetical protein
MPSQDTPRAPLVRRALVSCSTTLDPVAMYDHFFHTSEPPKRRVSWSVRTVLRACWAWVLCFGLVAEIIYLIATF